MIAGRTLRDLGPSPLCLLAYWKLGYSTPALEYLTYPPTCCPSETAVPNRKGIENPPPTRNGESLRYPAMAKLPRTPGKGLGQRHRDSKYELQRGPVRTLGKFQRFPSNSPGRT